MKYKSIVFITNESLKNVGNMQEYFRETSETCISFHYPHGYLAHPSYMDIYENGVHVFGKTFPKVSIPNNLIKQIVYLLYISYIMVRWVPKNSFVFVENPLFCLLSGLCRVFKGIRFVYWIGDYYPNARGLMRIYELLTLRCIRTLEYIGYASPPLKVKYDSLVPSHNPRAVHRVIPLGIKRKHVKRRTPSKGTLLLGFIGVIRTQQGLELVFEYLKTHREMKLEVVGDGYFLTHYKELSRAMGVSRQVRFYGYVKDADPMLRSWHVGLAPYEQGDDKLSRYAEPTKIKDYLSYGIPVITTPTTYMAQELENQHAGLIIDGTLHSFSKAMDQMSKRYAVFADGANRLSQKYDYASWYDRRFDFMSAGK